MKKKNSYFLILAALIIVVLIGWLVPVSEIKSAANSIIKVIQSPYILVAAVACAFIFINTKNYWWIMLGCGAATAVAIALLFGKGFDLTIMVYRTLAFLLVVYFLNLIKVILNK